MDASHIVQNSAERARLIALGRGLLDFELSFGLGGNWTVAVALAHLAFWDRRARLLLECWEQGQLPPLNEPDWYGGPLLNDCLLVEWRALPPHDCACLALDAASAVDSKIERLDAGVVAAIEAAGESWLLRRGRHRAEHLDQIERALPRAKRSEGMPERA